MSIYTRGAATANKQLEKYGQAVTYQAITTGTYNPETGTVTNTETEYTGFGALFDFKERQLGTNFAAGSTIEGGDKYALVAPETLTVTPKVNDKLVIGSDTWTVLNIKTLAPAGVLVLYTFHLRK